MMNIVENGNTNPVTGFDCIALQRLDCGFDAKGIGSISKDTLFTYSYFANNVEDIVQHDIKAYFEDAKIIMSVNKESSVRGTRGRGIRGESIEYSQLKNQGYAFLCFADKMRVQGKQNDYIVVVKPSAAVIAWFKKCIGTGIRAVEVTEPAGNVIFKSNDRTLSTSHLAGSLNLDDYRKFLDSIEI
ncbi:hypothetical protein OTK49_02340 [Vibrio coralliirubri]|uniref:hypothetical protein n=1 Tax=Vibrio coralliirubri TaxID=1516159 RepID=UPI002284FCFC|nr:hypothetical protein [Vibrio coralliirubri]MCY9861355.1 hypothetical protein [Vibrio coralliirubri]